MKGIEYNDLRVTVGIAGMLSTDVRRSTCKEENKGDDTL
jgi:hypothetical protein